VLFSIADLPEGNHTLVVEATGSHGASSAGSWIWIDAFDVISASSGVSVDLGSDAPVPVPVAGSPDQEAVRFEEYDASVGFRGQWAANALPVHSDGAARLSTNTGARTSFLFAGTGVRWIGVGDPWSGIARIYVDGELVTTADTYRETETFGLELATVVGLDPGMHELEIEVTGQKNPLSGGIGIWVDAFDVQPTGSTVLCEGGGSALAGSSSSGAAPVSESTVKEAVVSAATMVVEESDTAVQYAGSWHINNLAVHSGQQAAMAMDTGAQATFSFVGTGADWFGYSDGWSGIAEILVDGVTVGTVDTYDAAGSARTALYSVRDLPAGPHSLTVRVTGRQNPESGGSWIWIDGFGQR
jgi:hypothetical protein